MGRLTGFEPATTRTTTEGSTTELQPPHIKYHACKHEDYQILASDYLPYNVNQGQVFCSKSRTKNFSAYKVRFLYQKYQTFVFMGDKDFLLFEKRIA